MHVLGLGLAEDAGPADSRGGRRSTLVDLAPGLRFVGIDVGATSIDVAVTDGRLSVLTQVSEDGDVRAGPEKVLARSLELTRTDRLVSFDFGTAAPASGISADNFQVRWTGQVTPAFS